MPSRRSSFEEVPHSLAGDVGRAVCLSVVVITGLSVLAAVVLLPECGLLAELEYRRDGLAHQLACERKLKIYNERLIQAIPSDPVLAARLLMRHGNYQPVGCAVVETGARVPGETVPERLLRQARANHPRDKQWLFHACRWLDDSPTRVALVCLSLSALLAGIVLFSPQVRSGDRPKPRT